MNRKFVAAVCLLALLVSCRSGRVMETTAVAAHAADSSSVTTAVHVNASSFSGSIDSIVSVVLQRVTSRQTASEQQQEHISETITSYIDSLGREVRSEQRTIDRDVSRQLETLYQQWQQQQEERMSAEYARIDSLYEAFRAELEAHSADTVNAVVTPVLQNTGATGLSLRFLLFLLLLVCAVIVLSLSATLVFRAIRKSYP